jgi:hypothetical protein
MIWTLLKWLLGLVVGLLSHRKGLQWASDRTNQGTRLHPHFSSRGIPT